MLMSKIFADAINIKKKEAEEAGKPFDNSRTYEELEE